MIAPPPRLVNAAGPLTWLGGGPLAPEVADAMRDAAEKTWDLFDLHMWASGRLAELLAVPGVFVTAGASAAMTLSAAAVVSRGQFGEAALLPGTSAPRTLVIQRSHRTAYDRAWRTAGADFKEIGFAGPPGTGATQMWQLADALQDLSVVGVAYTVAANANALPLPEVVQVAHEHGRPVLVDAAACLPPLARLHDVVATHADFIAVSGGKALGGPQNSGLLVCAKENLPLVGLQMLDMDVDRHRFSDWFGASAEGLPHHGIGRGFKVSKETIVGLVAAVEQFVLHYDVLSARWHHILDEISSGIRGGSALTERHDGATGGPVLVLVGTPSRMSAMADALRRGTPRIEVGRHLLDEGRIQISPLALRVDDAPLVANRLREVWSSLQ